MTFITVANGWYLRKATVMKLFHRNKDVNMTEGNIFRLIINFAIPLMIGNFFQLLYNTVDAWVLGNYVSGDAFGAVNSLGSVINTVICIFQGMSVGASSVISQYFGASDEKKVASSVHTAVIMTFVLGIISTVVGVFMTEELLGIMRTPTDMLDDATLYLKIYFAGIMGLMFYNMFSSILRAVGDSTSPFVALAISSIINIVLDLYFVRELEMGVDGVAIATIIAQFFSAIYLGVILVKAKGSYRLVFKKVEYSWNMLWTIVRIGLPSAIQLGITSFSNIFVQSYINVLGESVVSGWGSYSKIDQFMLLPIQSVSLASTTFVGQNIGAGKTDRAKKGILASIVMTCAIVLVLLVPIMLFAEPITMIFNKETDIVKYGSYLLRLVSPFYVFICVNNVIAGALRGAGNTKAPTIILLFSFVLFRQSYLAFVTFLGYGQNLTWVALAYPFGWIVATVILTVYYKFAKWDNASVTKKHTHHMQAKSAHS